MSPSVAAVIGIEVPWPLLQALADMSEDALYRSLTQLQAHCHNGLGRLYSQTGHGEETRVVLTAAIDLCRAMEMTFWLPEGRRRWRK